MNLNEWKGNKIDSRDFTETEWFISFSDIKMSPPLSPPLPLEVRVDGVAWDVVIVGKHVDSHSVTSLFTGKYFCRNYHLWLCLFSSDWLESCSSVWSPAQGIHVSASSISQRGQQFLPLRRSIFCLLIINPVFLSRQSVLQWVSPGLTV